MTQHNLFGENELIDLVVQLPEFCRCGAIRATIGAGAGPHIAALRCVYCGVHRGWISRETYSFIAEVVRLAGKPTRPIVIRRSRTASDDGVPDFQTHHQTGGSRD
jgi:hypothetical protein